MSMVSRLPSTDSIARRCNGVRRMSISCRATRSTSRNASFTPVSYPVRAAGRRRVIWFLGVDLARAQVGAMRGALTIKGIRQGSRADEVRRPRGSAEREIVDVNRVPEAGDVQHQLR